MIYQVKHPTYEKMIELWDKYALAYEGGHAFLEEYLQKFSQREDKWDFSNRKKISYVPAFAKAAINEIKNSIFQRMVDITRREGTPSYMNAVAGRDKGVDRKSSTMNNFIGASVLPGLLSIGKVGIFVDMTNEPGATQLEQIGKNPYIYTYEAQDIRSWSYLDDNPGQFAAILLRDHVYETDPLTQLPIKLVKQYRYLRLVSEGVLAILYDKDGEQISERVLNIPNIPFLTMELSQSLLTDVADIQISLLNLASADMNYSFKSNFPFYTEQYDPRRVSGHLRQNNTYSSPTYNADGSETDLVNQPGTAASAATGKAQELVTGATRGRRYPINTERPAYISPSPEPLRVSMEKQEQLKRDIKLLVNLAVSNLIPRREASAESKAMDSQSLEAGLSYIGQELESGENRIAELWAMYESSRRSATVKYPTHYSLKTDAQRVVEAESKAKLRSQVGSKTYQKELSKDIAHALLTDKVGVETLNTIYGEVDNSDIPVLDPDTISQDIEQGLLSVETASEAKGYPEGEVEKAKVEHAERAARIVLAQTNAAARGVAALDANPSSPVLEKTQSQKDKTQDVVIKDKTRGSAK